jgi:homoserine O-acetyltransferase
MNHHDVGRNRGGIEEALGSVQADVTVAGITTDRLYPLALQEQLARSLPGRPSVSVVESVSGHDGFLLEVEQVGRVVRSTLASEA